MKKRLLAFISLVTLLVALVFAFAPDGGTRSSKLAILLVSFGKKARVVRDGKDLKKLQIGMALETSDRLIAAKKDPMDIWVGRIATIRVKPGAEVVVKEAIDDLNGIAGTSGVDVEVLKGAATARVRLLDDHSYFRMNGVPVLTAARSTGYEVAVLKPGSKARVTVAEGKVRVTSTASGKEYLDLGPGESVVVSPQLPKAAKRDKNGAKRVLAEFEDMQLPAENVAPGTVSQLPQGALAVQIRSLDRTQIVAAFSQGLFGGRPGQYSDFEYENISTRFGERLRRGTDPTAAARAASFPFPIYSPLAFGSRGASAGRSLILHGPFPRNKGWAVRDAGATLWYRDGQGNTRLLTRHGYLCDVNLSGTRVAIFDRGTGLVVVDLPTGRRYRVLSFSGSSPVVFVQISASGQSLLYLESRMGRRSVWRVAGVENQRRYDVNGQGAGRPQFLDTLDIVWHNNTVIEPATGRRATLQGFVGDSNSSQWLEDVGILLHTVALKPGSATGRPGTSRPYNVTLSKYTPERIRAGLAGGTVRPEVVTFEVSAPAVNNFWPPSTNANRYELLQVDRSQVIDWKTMDHWEVGEEKLWLHHQDRFSGNMLLAKARPWPQGWTQKGTPVNGYIWAYDPSARVLSPRFGKASAIGAGTLLPGGASFTYAFANFTGRQRHPIPLTQRYWTTSKINLVSKFGEVLTSRVSDWPISSPSDRLSLVDSRLEKFQSLHLYGAPSGSAKVKSALGTLARKWKVGVEMLVSLLLVALIERLVQIICDRRQGFATESVIDLDAVKMLTRERTCYRAGNQMVESVEKLRLTDVLTVIVLGLSLAAQVWFLSELLGDARNVRVNQRVAMGPFIGMVVAQAVLFLAIVGTAIRVRVGAWLGWVAVLGQMGMLFFHVSSMNLETVSMAVPTTSSYLQILLTVGLVILTRIARNSGRF